MRNQQLRWYWAAPALVYGIVVWRDDGPWWATIVVVLGLLLASFVTWRHRKDERDPDSDVQ